MSDLSGRQSGSKLVSGTVAYLGRTKVLSNPSEGTTEA
jgi:hypothetical protein